MWRKIKKFASLTSAEKKLFIEAYITLGIMRAAILVLSFKRITRSLEHYPEQKKPPVLDPRDLTMALAVGKAVERASSHTPWESACLVQVLSAQRMLQKRSIEGVFYLGAAKAKQSREKIEAHAWLQCDHRIITGAEGHEKYTVLSTVTWHK